MNAKKDHPDVYKIVLTHQVVTHVAVIRAIV